MNQKALHHGFRWKTSVPVIAWLNWVILQHFASPSFISLGFTLTVNCGRDCGLWLGPWTVAWLLSLLLLLLSCWHCYPGVAMPLPWHCLISKWYKSEIIDEPKGTVSWTQTKYKCVQSELPFSIVLSSLSYSWDWLLLWTMALTMNSDCELWTVNCELWLGYCHCYHCFCDIALVAVLLTLLPCYYLIEAMWKQDHWLTKRHYVMTTCTNF